MNLFANLDLLGIEFPDSIINDDMSYLFSHCHNLTSINFSNTDASSVVDIDYAFSHCKSLKSIDLSSLDLTSANNFENMFLGCERLEYINFPNYKESQIASSQFSLTIDDTVPPNLVICILQENAPTLYTSLSSRDCTVIYCGENWREKQKKIIYEDDGESYTCVDNCPTIYPYEFGS